MLDESCSSLSLSLSVIITYDTPDCTRVMRLTTDFKSRSVRVKDAGASCRSPWCRFHSRLGDNSASHARHRGQMG